MSAPVSLKQFILDLKQNRTRVLAQVKATSYQDAANLLEKMKLRSPLDKGLFRANWELKEVGRTAGKRITHRIQNRTFYAPFLDSGNEPGVQPWEFPNHKNPGPTSNSGKLRVINGRVWAGGKSPSGFVEPGIINSVIYYNVREQMAMVHRLANAVIGAI